MKRLVLMGAVVALLALPAAGLGAHVAPVLHQGNPTCADLGDYDHEFKVDPVSAGTHSDPASEFEVEITIVNTADGPTFNFEANMPVDAVFVKGGPGGNLYVYDPAETSDTGLHAPGNDSGTAVQDPPWSGLSHISFCFSSEPVPTDPPATDPPATDPPATDPPATDPPATDPPATDPPATDPPATDPPATDPPATDPPATDPPATDPPATDPPATDPPALTPPPTSMSDTGSGGGNILPVLLAGLLAAAFLFLRPAMRFSPVLRKR